MYDTNMKLYPIALQNIITQIRSKNVDVPSSITLNDVASYISEITVDDFLTPLTNAATAAEIVLAKEVYNDSGIKVVGTLEPDAGDIKAGVTIAGIEGTYYGPIQLDSIEITTPATDLEYTYPETFDGTDMVITANYDNLATRTIEDYTIAPSTGLEVADTEVVISFVEGGITKTVSQAITVAAKSLTASASALTTKTGLTTITLEEAVATLEATDFEVLVDDVPLVNETDYTITDPETATVDITFTEAAGLDSTKVITVNITKTNYSFNEGASIAVENLIA